MAQRFLSENRWRMVRRVLRKRTFRFEDARNMARQDRSHFDWLVAHGFFAHVGGEAYELTPKGKDAADLGAYELDLAPRRRTRPA